MRTFLGLIMVVIVSGDSETVSSMLHDSVLLPCSCPNRGVNETLYWQMENRKMSIFSYSNGNSTFKDRYKGRGKIFLPEHGNNCSVLLTNVTAEDQGLYRCSFKSQGIYKKTFVHLIVYASYNICQNESECHVKGLYRDAEIEWNLDGQPLRNSPKTNIALDDSTGLYNFTSKITSLNVTSGLKCTVKAKGISTTISVGCIPVAVRVTGEMPLRYRCLKIIPIVLMLGFFLVLWRRFKSFKSMPTIRRRETGNCY